MTPFGIEPATFRFVAQHLNRCTTAVPLLQGSKKLILWTRYHAISFIQAKEMFTNKCREMITKVHWAAIVKQEIRCKRQGILTWRSLKTAFKILFFSYIKFKAMFLNIFTYCVAALRHVSDIAMYVLQGLILNCLIGVPRGVQPPPLPEILKFWQSRTGLQIERKMFSVPIPTS